MFLVQNNVPDVYVNMSRDFQLVSRLYDLVFQSSRFSIDSMKNISDTQRCNEAFLPLLGTKLGFFDSLNIPEDQYRKVLSAFPYIIKNKGSLKGIKYIVNLFQRLVNNKVSFEYQDGEGDEPYSIVLKFEKSSPNQKLFDALIEYVRPAGVKITYIVETPVDNTQHKTILQTKDNYSINPVDNHINKANIGLVGVSEQHLLRKDEE